MSSDDSEGGGLEYAFPEPDEDSDSAVSDPEAEGVRGNLLDDLR